MRWTEEGEEISLLLVKSQTWLEETWLIEIKSHRIFISPAGLSKGTLNMRWGLISSGRIPLLYTPVWPFFHISQAVYLCLLSLFYYLHSDVFSYLVKLCNSQCRQSLRSMFCQRVIKCSLIIWLTQLKSCENCLAPVRAGIPHEAISSGAKVNVKQRIYSRLQSKHQQSRAQLHICTAPYTVLKVWEQSYRYNVPDAENFMKIEIFLRKYRKINTCTSRLHKIWGIAYIFNPICVSSFIAIMSAFIVFLFCLSLLLYFNACSLILHPTILLFSSVNVT